MKAKILLLDFDNTIAFTASGDKFPQGIWDIKFNFDLLDTIKSNITNLGIERIHIISNQGGIELGILNKKYIHSKFRYTCDCLMEYIDNNVVVTYDICESMSGHKRKPNIGMISNLFGHMEQYKTYSEFKEDCIMIGDASGLKGNFSDSDKKCAENAEIRYYDVNEFINLFKAI